MSMQVFHGLGDVPSGFGPSAVTIGKFDGVHTGHLAVIEALHERARATAARAVVVTFDRNPLAVLAPAQCPSALVSADQKMDLLGATGVDATLVVPFSREFAALPPSHFVRAYLVDALHATTVLVGADFRFGSQGTGDVALLSRIGCDAGFDVRIVDDVRDDVCDDVHDDGARRVSSTWIRELLSVGDVGTAAELLGRAPIVRGLVVHGAARGRELGYPTANLAPDSDGLIPADGVYAGWLDDAGRRYPAAISVGHNPTFDGVPHKQVEAYVLDREIELYDHVVTLEFTERIRGMVAFEGVGPLIAQMADDVDRVRALLV